MRDPVALPHDRQNHLAALTGIRLFAAVWVVVFHFREQLEGLLHWTTHLRPFVDSGYLGVDLFFTLSGFILAYNYLHRLGAGWTPAQHGRFLWLRLARIYPVHIFTLLAFIAMLAVAGATGVATRSDGPRTDSWAFVENILLIHAWFGEGLSFNNPAWSISAEWFAYLLFPLLAPLLLRVRSIPAAVGGALACYALLTWLWVSFYWDSTGTLSGALFRVELEFLAGVFIYVIWTRLPSTGGSWWPLVSAAALAAVVVGGWVLHAGDTHRGVVLAPLLGVFLLAIAASTGPDSRLLSTRWAVFGGEISYALYMTHVLLQPVINRVFPADRYADAAVPMRLLVLAVIFAVLAGAAVATWRFIEEPCRRRMRRHFREPARQETVGA